MASRASAVLEVERQNLIGPATQAGLVAFRACDSGMGSGKRESRIAVLCNRIRRTVKIFDGMAVLATILVRRCGELLVMGVLVTIHAGREFDLIDSVLASGRVALLASDSSVFSFQRIVGSRVLLHAKLRRLPPTHHVALRTLTLAGASLELALMRVGGVAIRASGKSYRPLEIASYMTFGAAHLEVHPDKRIFRFRMIKLHRRADLLPTAGGVTGFTGSLKGSLVRIGMAGDASIEFNSRELHGLIRSRWEVAFVASNLGMKTR